MTQNNQHVMQLLARWECRDATFQAAEPPLVFHRARGSRIWDADGRSYVDLCAGFGVMALGHNSDVQRRVFEASLSDASLIVHGMGDVYPSTAKAELLAYLASLLPSHLTKASLALSGGQAVELAVKTAQLATRRHGFITFSAGYHGLDLGILPLTSRRDFKDPFRNWIPEHLVEELPFACSLEAVAEAMERQAQAGHACAAVLVEPIQGRAGIRPAPLEWLQGLADLCRSKGALLIYDEVFTGLGRTGRWTYAEQVPCDLLCLGKALGGGLPLSACFGRPELMDAWPQNQGEAIHTGTFFGHPLSCRMAKATLEAIAEGRLLERARSFGQKIRDDLIQDLGSHPQLKSIRGEGLMIGVELQQPGSGARWMDLLRAEGVIALASGMEGQGLSITPALTLPEADWEEARTALVRTLERV